MALPHILILCTGNSCRSQMAEGFFRHLAGDRLRVSSAGLQPTSVHPMAITVMGEIGVDISGQRSKSIDEFIGLPPADLVIAVCENAERQCPRVYPNGRSLLYWPFPDPGLIGATDPKRQHDAFTLTRDMIRERIELWLRSEAATRMVGSERT